MRGLVLSSLVLSLFCLQSIAGDWSQFRGPGGNGVSSEVGLPTKWSSKENAVWRLELPGLGTSSPIVVGQKIFLTCYSGYAESVDNPGDGAKLMRHLVCVDQSTGKPLWKKDFEPVLPESVYEGNNNTRHGYSSSTPASDGKHLFVFFGSAGAYCFDFNGNQVWHKSVGDKVDKWGSGTSPVLFEDLVIFNASVESGDMLALDKQTGEEKWRAKGMNRAWNTPILVKTAAGETELVISIPKKVIGLDPKSGKELWQCKGIQDGYVCPSAVTHAGIIYLLGGRREATPIAVRSGGRGDVTNTHVLWAKGTSCNVSSPVYHEGHLYWVNDGGMAMCVDAANGEAVYQQRLEPRPGIVYASPVVADGKLYFPSQHNGVFVLAAKPKYELLAHNVFEDDDHRMNASAAIQDGQILLRNDKYLYCIGKRRSAADLSAR